MSTDNEPTFTVKLLQLLLLSTYWGMQIWVTFISSWYRTRTRTWDKSTQKSMKQGKEGERMETHFGCRLCLGHLLSCSMQNTIND